MVYYPDNPHPLLTKDSINNEVSHPYSGFIKIHVLHDPVFFINSQV